MSKVETNTGEGAGMREALFDAKPDIGNGPELSLRGIVRRHFTISHGIADSAVRTAAYLAALTKQPAAQEPAAVGVVDENGLKLRERSDGTWGFGAAPKTPDTATGGSVGDGGLLEAVEDAIRGETYTQSPDVFEVRGVEEAATAVLALLPSLAQPAPVGEDETGVREAARLEIAKAIFYCAKEENPYGPLTWEGALQTLRDWHLRRADVILSGPIFDRESVAFEISLRGKIWTLAHQIKRLEDHRDGLPENYAHMRAMDDRVIEELVSRAGREVLTALAPQPPKAETPAGVGYDTLIAEALEKYQQIDGYHKEPIIEILEAFGAVLLGHAVLSTAPAARPGDEVERVRHVKRGTEYEVLGEAVIQIATEKGEPSDGRRMNNYDPVMVYRSLDTGELWVRPYFEFHDGRFVPAATPAADGGRA